jgi:dipeptidyl aminopeptidase/acylaminoacyl peptidase
MSYLYPKKRALHPFQILLLAALGVLIGLAIAFFVCAPRVIAVSPGANERTGSFASIEINFSVPMDPLCTANHFSVEPAVEGELVIQGAGLRFTPAAAWPAGSMVRASIQSGACSQRGLPLLAGQSWTFSASLVRIAYIPSGESSDHLIGIAVDGGNASELAQVPIAIQDFDISRRGNFAVLSTGSYDQPGDLWMSPLDGGPASLLLDCGGDSCRDPEISPDGLLLAYVRDRIETSSGPATLPLEPFIELLTLSDGLTRMVSPAGHTAGNPTWSAQGWLSYFDGTRQVIIVDDLAGGQTAVPNAAGAAWAWLPDGSGLIFPEIFEQEGMDTPDTSPRIYSHLFQVDIKTNQHKDLSGTDILEDASPAVSPDNRWVAFSRNFFDDRWTPGKQLWIMNLEDGTLRQLSQAPDYSHSSIHWSPDGSLLVFMIFHETVPGDPPEIWCLNADGSDPRRLVAGGFLPKWLP